MHGCYVLRSYSFHCLEKGHPSLQGAQSFGIFRRNALFFADIWREASSGIAVKSALEALVRGAPYAWSCLARRGPTLFVTLSANFGSGETAVEMLSAAKHDRRTTAQVRSRGK